MYNKKEMDKTTMEFQIYMDVWNLHKKYYGLTQDEKDDERWENLVQEADELLEVKYKDTPYEKFYRELAVAMISVLGKVSTISSVEVSNKIEETKKDVAS